MPAAWSTGPARSSSSPSTSSRTDDTTGFVVLPRRWVVERTLSWLMRSRRLARDYETRPAMHEAMVLWSMTMLMSGRLLAGRRPGAFSRPAPQAR
ncbi:transposase [Streptomyces sp. NPDC050564]|uniref:transposase n=1 Tax=Streptomyces sp. NPDC050564 TaxID=3365631 RepID=UPI0037B62E8B